MSLAIDPESFKALENLGLSLSNKGLFGDITPDEADALFQESQECFNQAIQIESKIISGYLNSAIAYYYQAQVHMGNAVQAKEALSRAYGRFAEAANAENSFVAGKDLTYSVYHNWGLALLMHARLAGNTPADTKDLLVQAESKVRCSIPKNLIMNPS
jgi:tetratricopeptide (TPR) repeat protein